MANRDSDSYVYNIPRHTVLYHAKRGVRELFYDTLQQDKVIELDISSTLKVILPPDFVNYRRISWVDDNGILHPMAEDRRQSNASAYLQDNNYELLYDNNGCVLQADGKRRKFNEEDTESEVDGIRSYLFSYGYYNNFTPNTDLSNVFPNGKFRFDKQAGIIEFGSNVIGQSIVLEYISDGLYSSVCGGTEEDIKVHKFAEEALIEYIYYSIVKSKRNATGFEKQFSRKNYYNSKRVAKRRLSTIRKEELLQTFKGDSVWIKGLQKNY